MMDTFNIISGLITFLSTILTVVFYYKVKLSKKDIEAEKNKWIELRKHIHWQLQAMHHACNRIENIMLDPDRPDRGVIEVARGIRDDADSIMGQLLGNVTVFPWANAAIIDPPSGKEIGRLIGTEHRYKENFVETYPYAHHGKYAPEKATGKKAVDVGDS